MTHVLLEQLASQRQAELAERAARHQRTGRRRLPTTTTGTRRTEPRLVAARLADLVGRS